jgi:anthranilate synthase component I
MITPDFETFADIAKKYNLVPIYTELVADWLSPVTALQRLDDGGPIFLLESVEGGEKWARYSYIGCAPQELFRVKGNEVTITHTGNGTKTITTDRPLDELRKIMQRYRPCPVKGLPRFYGGAVGYLGHEIAGTIEKLPKNAKEVLNLDDAHFMLTDTIVIFDQVRHTVKLVANVHVEDGADFRQAYDEGCEQIKRLEERLLTPSPRSVYPPVQEGTVELKSNVSREQYHDMVNKAREYIIAGDIIQVVISQRFECPLPADVFDLYRALRLVNPSPYMFLLRTPGQTLVGSSPEVMVRLEEGVAELRPIAGTRPRAKDENEDRRLAAELLDDPKERAEHVMLVDLGRNDLGRVAADGTVQVNQYMVVERYSHVMHLVSNVRSQIAEGKDAFDLVEATFPAGTVSGAPKVRALEIIDELEPERRGPYGGSVGYFSYSGNMDMGITIRTAICTDDMLYLQAGAGIVYDSDPQKEYEETQSKARAVARAIDLARAGLDLSVLESGKRS